MVGTSIKVKFYLPPRINLDDFKELLSVAGRYVGCSSYGYKQDFGRFTVEKVEVLRAKVH